MRHRICSDSNANTSVHACIHPPSCACQHCNADECSNPYRTTHCNSNATTNANLRIPTNINANQGGYIDS